MGKRLARQLNWLEAGALQAALEHVLAASEDGGSFADVDFDMLRKAVADARAPQSERDQKIVEMAQLAHLGREGEVEVDDGAVVSESGPDGDNGAYVQAWVWVSFDGTEFDKEVESGEQL